MLTSAALAVFALEERAVERQAFTLAGLREFWAPLDSRRDEAVKVPTPPK